MVFSSFLGFISNINEQYIIHNLKEYNYNFYVDSDLIDDTSYLYSVLFNK